LAFRNGFDYRNFRFKNIQLQYFSAYFANLIKIDPVTPEITGAKKYTFLDKMAKIVICMGIIKLT